MANTGKTFHRHFNDGVFGGVESRTAPGDKEIPKADPKKGWIASPLTFRKLLTWLDEGVDSGGARYVEMRHRLVSYFQRKHSPTADDLADETLNRIVRKLEEGTIADAKPASYCYTVAKFVFLESLRRPEQFQSSPESLTGGRDKRSVDSLLAGSDAGGEVRERLLDCLERCLSELTSADRELILDYYRDEQRARIDRRRELAARLGVTQNALSIRACRIRAKLQACVRECSGEGR